MRLINFLLLLISAASVTRADEIAIPITSCGAVRALRREDAARKLPVQVRGVVTLVRYPPADHFTFVLNDGTGIWVSPTRSDPTVEMPASLKVGDVVEVTGRTLDGRFSPTISGQTVRVVGHDELPSAQQVTVLGLSSGKFDSQRVAISGVVQAVEFDRSMAHPELRLRVRSEISPFNFILMDPPDGMVPPSVDSELSLEGVCLSYFNSRGQFLGARIYSNQARDVVVNVAGVGDPFDALEVPLARIMAFSPEGLDLHRRKVRGIVTLSSEGGFFYLQDESGALRVNTRQRDTLQPGDIVEAAGFFDLTHHKAELHEAVFRRIGKQAPPAPSPITRELAFAREPQTVYVAPQDFDDRLVSLHGRFVSVDRKDGSPLRLNLMWEGALVAVEFVDSNASEFIEALRPGSVLRVYGVCRIRFSQSRPVIEWPQPIEVNLLARGSMDVEVVALAPFWDTPRLLKALGVALLALVAVLAWVALLRRQVAHRGQQLAEEIRARRDAAVEFDSSMRERNRLAADLHDTMEQSLTGLAFQIDASQALHVDTPEQSQQHLSLARQLLARSREDLRRSIWNLRANPLERQNLADALREVATDRSVGLPIKISVECVGGQRPLPDFIAGNMLLLVQEGITNALKHADATEIRIELAFAPGSVDLTVQDNGKGFNPATVAGPKSGHFGLQGMRERVKRLGGRFKLTSAPGLGTTVIASVND